METLNQNTNVPDPQPENRAGQSNRSGRIMGGLIIVAIGVLLLARKAGVEFPDWLFSFEAILIALGLYLGFRHSFKGFGWVIPVLIGGFLLLDDFYPYYDLEHFTWPIIIIGIGLYVIFKSAKKRPDWSKWEAANTFRESSSEDYLESVVVFGGIKKNIFSKNFKGGETVTVFGGTEINLTQADINGVVVLELTQVFGGTKLIVPPHWRVHTKDVVAIFGGIDDKRPIMTHPAGEETNKLLILKGTCLLGGIDIRSY